MNDCVFEAVKMSLLYDFKRVYNHYKDQDSNVKGVEFKFNVSHGFGEYIYNNPDKLSEMINYFNDSLSFGYKFIFDKEGEEEFYPMI